MDVHENIDQLFSAAKAADEFEYCCTLLRIRGLESPGWDPLQESISLIDQLLAMIEAPIQDSLQIRLVLMLYCHITEMNDLYNIIGNLIRIASHNDRYSMLLFPNSKYPTQKINEIMTWANETEYVMIPQNLEAMLVRQLRNAFFHSDYVLTSSAINLVNGQSVVIDGIGQQSIPLKWIQPKVNLAIDIVRYVIAKTIQSIREYKESKILKGRFAADESMMDLELIVDPKWGLTGFRSYNRSTPNEA